ncbi:hypothetical protein KEM54_000032 [Ascosphaera aggregata]|nr:hypothetical protein KEM54_000032 [Ascosphaera aggregata]
MEDNERLELEGWLQRGVLTGQQSSQLTTKHLKDREQKQLLLMSDVAHGLLISQYASNPFVEVPDWPLAVTFPCRCFVMPDNRLRGNPWTTEKVRFLEMMALVIRENRFGMPQLETVTCPPLQISAQAVHEGIESAITENNVEALTLLLKDYLADKQISPQYFSSAIHQPAGAELLKALITYRPLSLPHDDSEITQFAMTLKDQGNPFGDEVLDHMLHLPGLIATQEAAYQSASSSGIEAIRSSPSSSQN